MDQWTSKLRKLNPNVSKAKGDGNARFAPHKPLLLLCLIDLLAIIKQEDRV